MRRIMWTSSVSLCGEVKGFFRVWRREKTRNSARLAVGTAARPRAAASSGTRAVESPSVSAEYSDARSLPVSSAAVAAAAAMARQRREEEEMSGYSAQELAEGWEFKIVRSATSAFKRPEFLRQ